MQTIRAIKSKGTINPITLETNPTEYKDNSYSLDNFKDEGHRSHVLKYIEGELDDVTKSEAPVALSKKSFSYVLTSEGEVEKKSSKLTIHSDGTYEYYSARNNKDSEQKAIE